MRQCAMRLSCNMATGKGLIVIFLPRTINFIGNNKLKKFSCNVLQQGNTCRRHLMTVASTVGCLNRDKAEKSKVHTFVIEFLDYIIAQWNYIRFKPSSACRRLSRVSVLIARTYVPHFCHRLIRVAHTLIF